MRHAGFIARVTLLFVLVALLSAAQLGCGEIVLNQIAERSGDVEVVFINNTSYRAALSYGTWDALDLDPPGAIDLQQARIEAFSTTAGVTIDCARNFAVGTQDLVDRALATDAPADLADFDADAFDATIHFSDAPADSDLAGAATVGTAVGIEKLLGVEYACGDQLFITLEEDPDAPGGFRLDFSRLAAPEDE